MSNHYTTQPQPPPNQTQPVKSPGLEALILPALILFACFIINSKAHKTQIPEGMPCARFATKREIRKGNNVARKLIAGQELTHTAFELNPETKITFAECNPGGIIPGLSGMGKSLNVILPLIRSAIRQAHTIFVTDIEGELISKTAAYALHHGYKLYAYAPGVTEMSPWGKFVQFTGAFSFLDVMRHPDDKAKAQEISRALNVNTQEDTQKRHAYFGPQSDALMESMLMLAKGSKFPDMLMVWALITLPDLADRLDVAEKEGRFGKDLPYFAKQASAGIRQVAGKGGGKGDSPSASIQSSAFNMFSKFIDPGILQCLLPSTIPLEHSGPSIVYVRIDRTQLKATSPLGATALQLWLNYNLDPQRKRNRNLTLISDEANFFVLPDLEALAKLARKKGGTFWLAFQQNIGMELAYGKERWKSLASNLKNKVFFSTGEDDYHEKISTSLGKKTIITKTANSSSGRGSHNRGTTDHFEKIPLVSADKLTNSIEAGQCVVKSTSYKHPVNFLDSKIPYDPDSETAKTEQMCEKAWEEKILPALQEEHEDMMCSYTDPVTGEVTALGIEDEIMLREKAAELLLPHPDLIAARKQAAAAKKAAEARAKQPQPPQTIMPS